MTFSGRSRAAAPGFCVNMGMCLESVEKLLYNKLIFGKKEFYHEQDRHSCRVQSAAERV